MEIEPKITIICIISLNQSFSYQYEAWDVFSDFHG